MTDALNRLIREASMQLGSDACKDGRHLWESDGGRHRDPDEILALFLADAIPCAGVTDISPKDMDDK